MKIFHLNLIRDLLYDSLPGINTKNNKLWNLQKEKAIVIIEEEIKRNKLNGKIGYEKRKEIRK